MFLGKNSNTLHTKCSCTILGSLCCVLFKMIHEIVEVKWEADEKFMK